MIRAIRSGRLAELVDGGLADPELPAGRVRVFDLRSAERFAEGHVPGARHVPPEQAMRWIPQWVEPYELVVLVDEDGSQGGTARHVCVELVHQWFRRLRYLEGGMARWSAEQLASERGGPSGESAASDCGKQVAFHRSAEVPWSTSENALPPDPARVRYGKSDEESASGS